MEQKTTNDIEKQIKNLKTKITIKDVIIGIEIIIIICLIIFIISKTLV